MSMKTINEVYAGTTFEQAEMALRMAGGLSEAAKFKGKSLTSDERKYIMAVREKSTLLGLSINMQTTIEMEGAEIVRRALSRELR